MQCSSGETLLFDPVTYPDIVLDSSGKQHVHSPTLHLIMAAAKAMQSTTGSPTEGELTTAHRDDFAEIVR